MGKPLEVMESGNVGVIDAEEKEKYGIAKAVVFTIKVAGLIHPRVTAVIFLKFG
jgi:hypothetical protein